MNQLTGPICTGSPILADSHWLIIGFEVSQFNSDDQIGLGSYSWSDQSIRSDFLITSLTLASLVRSQEGRDGNENLQVEIPTYGNMNMDFFFFIFFCGVRDGDKRSPQ